MSFQAIFHKILAAIETHPNCKHVKSIIDDNKLIIFGKYNYVARLYYIDRGMCFSDSVNAVKFWYSTGLQEYIGIVIEHIKNEHRPYTDKNKVSERRFYKNNFPCLADEVDYSYYRNVEGQKISNMINGAGPIERVCPELYHWDLLAFERKVHAALDGSRLPLPIRNEIFSLFAY